MVAALTGSHPLSLSVCSVYVRACALDGRRRPGLGLSLLVFVHERRQQCAGVIEMEVCVRRPPGMVEAEVLL